LGKDKQAENRKNPKTVRVRDKNERKGKKGLKSGKKAELAGQHEAELGGGRIYTTGVSRTRGSKK
jgi:hypothetical protein